jgi:hypothetical protein
LAYEAKRRPHLQALMERAHLLTDEEIENADVPLKWYKSALYQMRERKRLAEAHRVMNEDTVTLDPNAVRGGNAVEGLIFEVGAAMTVYFGNKSRGTKQFIGDGLPVEIQAGDLFFVLKDGSGVWYDHFFANHPPAGLRGKKVGEGIRKEYVEKRRIQLNRRHGVVHDEIEGPKDHYVTDSEGNQVRQTRITSASFR